MGDSLVAIIASLLPSAKIAGLTLAQWEAIVAAIDAAAPEIKAVLAELEPAFGKIVGELAQGSPHDAIAEKRIREIPSEMSDPR